MGLAQDVVLDMPAQRAVLAKKELRTTSSDLLFPSFYGRLVLLLLAFLLVPPAEELNRDRGG
jgi:hypothetical protein